MNLFGFFRKVNELTPAQCAALCAEFQPEFERVVAATPDQTQVRDEMSYIGFGIIRHSSVIDTPLSPVAEAGVYLAYQKWDDAITALQRGLSLEDAELALPQVENPRAYICDLLARMRAAQARTR